MVERIGATDPGRVEVVGRWYGVRGRRFVRPALTIVGPRAGAVRTLAELDDKPWPAEDGLPWRATFAVTLEDAAEMELTVAPDITVSLTRSGEPPAQPGDQRVVAGNPAAPVAKAAMPTRQRPSVIAPANTDQVNVRLAAAGQSLQRERERRTAAELALETERRRRSEGERALEEERAQGRRLRMQVGQVQAQLALAQAGSGEPVDSEELHELRRELTEAEQRVADLKRERDRLAREHAEIQTTLHERTGALESARQALEAARGESRRLRNSQSPPGSSAGTEHHKPPLQFAPQPDEEWADVAGAGERVTRFGPHPGAASPATHPRSAANVWFGRLVALLVLIAVVVAIVIVVHSTVSH